MLTNYSATKNPSRVVSVQTSLRITTLPADSVDAENAAQAWVGPITTALAAVVPDYAQYSFL